MAFLSRWQVLHMVCFPNPKRFQKRSIEIVATCFFGVLCMQNYVDEDYKAVELLGIWVYPVFTQTWHHLRLYGGLLGPKAVSASNYSNGNPNWQPCSVEQDFKKGIRSLCAYIYIYTYIYIYIYRLDLIM